jgi:hypothetical protein
MKMQRLVLEPALAGLAAIAAAQETPENLALGKKYQLEPAPAYPHCTDAGDRTQLTDGQYVQGYFWTQKGTVGWSGQSLVIITIDLEKPEPIAGLSFNTAAGVAGVHFPKALYVLTSDNGKIWHLAGELVALSARQTRPPASGYALHCFRTMDLATRGRFVKLLLAPEESFAFVDEIEVYRGPDDLMDKAAAGREVTDVRGFFNRMRFDFSLRARLEADRAAVARQLKSARASDTAAQRLSAELDAIARAVPSVEIESQESFTTVFPINELHRRIFAVQAGVWRANGLNRVIAWPCNRWDMLTPTEAPRPAGVALEVAMMANEYRSAAFNLSNAGTNDATVTLAFTGLPGGTAPRYITVHEVPFTDTKSGVPVAAALPYARQEAGRFLLRIPPGLTRQVWLTIHSAELAAGEYRGRIVWEADRVEGTPIPVRLKVYPFTFPSQPTLHLGGWDYTDRERCYEVTPENRGAFIRHLREHFVDSPWAQSPVLAHGKHDRDGRMVQPPNPAEFRTWLDRWPGARNYLVFANVGESFVGFRMGSAAFTQAVADWITWWVGQLRQWNIQPGQLGLLLVDEPRAPEHDRIVIEYARIIRAAQPEVIIWEDPIWEDPFKAAPELFELSHVLCPNLPMWISRGPTFTDFYRKQRQGGRRLWFYSCSGPGRLLDPYSYHRLQPWFCWKHGAEGEGFWAFGDSNGASSWNEYGAQIGAFTPLFLDTKSVTPGKHMEAVREGVEDYEYLRLLRDRLEALEKKEVQGDAVTSARRLLDSAADRVIGSMTSSSLVYWKEAKDRTIADQVRVEILDALTRLPVP